MPSPFAGPLPSWPFAAILPKNKHSDDNLIFTVLGVTVLLTLAMIGYPILGQYLALDDQIIGVFLGATIHVTRKIHISYAPLAAPGPGGDGWKQVSLGPSATLQSL